MDFYHEGRLVARSLHAARWYGLACLSGQRHKTVMFLDVAGGRLLEVRVRTRIIAFYHYRHRVGRDDWTGWIRVGAGAYQRPGEGELTGG